MTSRIIKTLEHWFVAGSVVPAVSTGNHDGVEWGRIVPFALMHIVCLAVIWVGVSFTAAAVGAFLYFLRMFAVTGFYHRYFAHRSFKTSRTGQFVFAVLGASAVQRGPIWWAAHHRHHHSHSDKDSDVHSPTRRGFIWSHMGWFLSKRYFVADMSQVRDLSRFPELRLLDRFDILVPVGLAVMVFVLGIVLEHLAPNLGTTRWQMLIWGFFISTVACYHATYSINSFAHRFGSQRFDTGDDSRNNLWLALLTLGEGWHNNHHRYPASARQGFFWWEIDITYYLLRGLAALGIVSDLRPVPLKIRTMKARP
jgi:stearoyl-CoA desaturase (Delta-9 desaturase)